MLKKLMSGGFEKKKATLLICILFFFRLKASETEEKNKGKELEDTQVRKSNIYEKGYNGPFK